MKKIVFVFVAVFSMLSCCRTSGPAVSGIPPRSDQVIPVTGTWVNLAWQDERNNYMNAKDEELNTDPELWADKMAELHEIGVDYIVIMQTANEGKAYYPSELMPHHYPDGRKSPVEAIMDTCDELGMQVFMSCGWAYDQSDNVGDPKVVARQCEMMGELGALYGDRPSFYGWYLPIEDCLIPYLPDRSVTGINRLTAKAHEITPGKRTMVAPYGIFGAELDNPAFGEQLSKIDVDIIAYQDEVGCVRERFPMHRMKENFRKLGEIHEKLGIEFWVDLEAFTWDRATNSQHSTLIPAEFGRLLSQFVGASQAGAKRILSFAIYGIFDKPGSRHPLGQPEKSAQAYTNYQNWLAGDPHWKLLEDIFTDKATNDAEGSVIAFSSEGIPNKAQRSFLPKLVDGQFGYEDPGCNEWLKCTGCMDVTIDLGSEKDIAVVAPHFLNYTPDRIGFPRSLDIYTSVDGTDFQLAASAKKPEGLNDKHDCWTDIYYFTDLGKARYVRVAARTAGWSFIECDEIIVKY